MQDEHPPMDKDFQIAMLKINAESGWLMAAYYKEKFDKAAATSQVIEQNKAFMRDLRKLLGLTKLASGEAILQKLREVIAVNQSSMGLLRELEAEIEQLKIDELERIIA